MKLTSVHITSRASAPAFRSLSTSAPRSNSPQHPGKQPGLDHLDNPTAAEAEVHAEKAKDPLPDSQKAGSGSTDSTVESVKKTVEGAVDAVKQAVGVKVGSLWLGVRPES